MFSSVLWARNQATEAISPSAMIWYSTPRTARLRKDHSRFLAGGGRVAMGAPEKTGVNEAFDPPVERERGRGGG